MRVSAHACASECAFQVLVLVVRVNTDQIRCPPIPKWRCTCVRAYVISLICASCVCVRVGNLRALLSVLTQKRMTNIMTRGNTSPFSMDKIDDFIALIFDWRVRVGGWWVVSAGVGAGRCRCRQV